MSRCARLLLSTTLVLFSTGLLLAQQQNVQRIPAVKDELREKFTQQDYENQLKREKNGEIPYQGGKVPSRRTSASDLGTDVLVNNNAGATGTQWFTQSETDIIAFGNNVVIAFNDAGSNATGSKFTGWSYSTNGGASFTDGGTLPTSTIGDAGDPVLARNDATGRIYLSTLGFSGARTIQMFRSDDNGVTWQAPTNATPGGSSEDKQWHTVDNFPGPGNGNVYMISRRFGTGPGIYVFRSTDHGDTFTPSGGVLIVSGQQGAFIAVGPDHAVYAFWYAGTTLQMRKSTDQGVTFGSPITVASGLVGGTNGDLGLTGIRQGTTTASGFRSNEFPHVAINPTSGNIHVTYNNDGVGADKADIFHVQSTDGGTTWSAPFKINDDVTTTDQWQPTLAITPTGTQIGIFYYSRQEDPANNLFKYYGRIGNISGSTVTWLPSFAISDTASLPEFGRDAVVNSVYMGDYNHAYATATAFHVVWSDNRSDLPGGAPRKDPNVYYDNIASTSNFGWAKGVTVSTAGGAIISGVEMDITNATPFAGATSDAFGRFKVGARVDSPATTRSVIVRGRKFGYVDTTRTVIVTRNDTLDMGNFPMRPAPGGTLSVFSHTATTNLRSFVEVKLGSTVVLADSTNGTTGLLTAPLPVGTYSVRVDAPPPNLTRNFPSVVINAGATTNVDALTQGVLAFDPTAVRDTLSVGGSHSKNLLMTNTSPDTVRFRISDDNAAARMRARVIDQSLPSAKRSMEQQPSKPAVKGQEIPIPQPASPDGRGGPDAFGYSWIDSDEPGGPTFSWVDISTNGTQITGLGDDTNVGPFPIGFNFPFYGTNFNAIRFCTNGFVSFTSTATTFSNSPIPNAAEPNNAIYPFWDDLIFSATNGARAFYRYDTTNARFIIQYDKVLRFGAVGDTLTFQVMLKPNGEIITQYLSMVGLTNSATIGIENAAGTVALQVVSDATYMHNNLAIRFFLPDAPWLSENPIVGAIPPLGNQNVVVSFDATGLVPGTTYNAIISVDATHPDVTRPFNVPASLRVNAATGAVINVSPTNLTFPTTAIGTSRRDSSRVRNVGSSLLTITSVTTTNARFAATATSTSIAAGDSARIRVVYTPVVPAGSDTGRVIILSNDPGNPRVDIILNGTSIGVPVFLTRVDSLVRPAMVANTRDSLRFFVRNAGTTSGNFAARAIMFPRTAASMVGPVEPIVVPVEIKGNQPQAVPPTSMADFGPAPRSAQGPIGGTPITLDVINAIGIQVGTTNSLVKFDLAVPTTLVNYGTVDQSFAGDFDVTTGRILAIRQTAPTALGTIDTATRAFTLIGNTTPNAGETWTAMKIDPASGTLYATGVTLTATTIYTINRTTGAATQVATVPRAPALIGFDFDNTGQMIGYTLGDSLYRINKNTGDATVIGYIGFNANFAQDMDFDRSSGTCYLAAYNGGTSQGELRIANLTTGNTTVVGLLGAGTGVEIDCFSTLTGGSAIAPWLSVVPTSGTIAIGDSVQMTARFDATDPSIYTNPGNYFGRIEVNATNSALADTLKIPVRMFVVPGVNPDLVVVPDSVDFGIVALGRTDSSKTVLLRNIGGSTLTITNITSSNPVFSPSVTSRTIASLDTFRLRLRFASAAPAGVKLGTLTFTSNDPSPPTVRMRGVAQGVPGIVVRPDTFYYNRRNTPDTTRSTFFVRNSGTDTLRYTIDEALPPSAANDRAIERSQEQQPAIERAKGVENSGPGQPPARINGRGGPDAFGYTWIDSDEPGGPPFNWIDIRSTGTAVTLTDDQNVDLGPLGFNVSFYGNTYSSIRVCSNGWLSFTSTSTSFSNGPIPSTAEPNNALYGFWDDLNPGAGGTVHYLRDVANNRFVVQWTQVPRFGATTDSVTFQIIVRSNGDIMYQYLRMVGLVSSSTVGIENATGTIALQVVSDAAYIHNNLAVLLTRDLLPWMSTDRTAGTLAPGDSQAVSLRIHPAALPGGTYRGHQLVRGNTTDVGRVRVRLDLIGDTTVTVTSPNGGELLNIGQTFPITWNQFGVDSVQISYSTTGRTGTYTQIAVVPARPGQWIHPKALARGLEGTTVDMVDGTYSWLVPNTPSTNCFVRIARRSTGRPADTSDAAFTIRTTPVVNDTGWVIQPSGTANTLYTTKAVSNTVAWAGGAAGTVLRTTNGGTTWTSVGGGTIGTADVYAIEARDANNAWVTTSPGGTFIYRTTNGGTSWTQVFNDPTASAFLDGIQMTSATNGWAMGDPVTNGGQNKYMILRTTDGGATWARIATEPVAPTGQAGWNNSFQVLGNSMWFGTNQTGTWRTTDLGATWSFAATTGNLNSFAIWFNSATLGMSGGAAGANHRSTNGGAAWASATVAGTNMTALGGVNQVSGQEFWATSGTNVYWTNNHGTTWAANPKNGYTGAQTLNHVSMVQVGVVDVYGWAVGNAGTILRYRRLSTDVESGPEAVPTIYSLGQNYPNPFNPTTTIKFALPEQANVSLKVYNLLGQEVATLANGEMPAAFHNVVWNGRNNAGAQVATGMYFYRLEAKGVSGETFNSLKKLILLK